MANGSSQSITMTAEPSVIMDVIADFAAYPEWAGAVKSVEVTVPGTDGRAKQVKF
ncbi:MAG: SRPBCC family protein, partial [Nakamurella multipartita]